MKQIIEHIRSIHLYVFAISFVELPVEIMGCGPLSGQKLYEKERHVFDIDVLGRSVGTREVKRRDKWLTILREANALQRNVPVRQSFLVNMS